eukprot:scaffold1662_cov121-Skeletonema_marinoi.AAC.5
MDSGLNKQDVGDKRRLLQQDSGQLTWADVSFYEPFQVESNKRQEARSKINHNNKARSETAQ